MLQEKPLRRQRHEQNDARATLELAREAHQKYLTRCQAADLEDAVDYYIKTLKLDPGLAETYYRLACLLFEKGDISIETAVEQCKTAVKMSPDNANAHMYAAYFLKIAQNFEEAEREFCEAIKLHPLKSARARLFLSTLLMEKSAQSNQTLKDIVRSMHYLVTGSVMMLWDTPVLKMMMTGVRDDVNTFKYRFLGNFYESFKKNSLAVKTYLTAAQITGQSSDFYHRAADMCIREGKPELAMEAYRAALNAEPYNRELLIKVATLSQTYFEDNYDETIDCYTRLLEMEPTNAKIYYELGHLYLQKDDKINAINAFKLALDYDENNAFYHNSMGYALVQVEHYDMAIEHYKKAVSINPENEWTAIVCQALGLIYHQIKENGEAAMAFYDMAIVLNPNSSDAHIAIGDIHFDDGNIDDAIKAYCDAVALDPENPKAYGKAGMALWEKDYVEEAIIAYNKAIKLDPEYSVALNNLGVIYLDGIGNVAESVNLFERALDINPNYVLANFNLGRAFHAMQNRPLAAEYYQIALDLNKITSELDEEDVRNRLFDLFKV